MRSSLRTSAPPDAAVNAAIAARNSMRLWPLLQGGGGEKAMGGEEKGKGGKGTSGRAALGGQGNRVAERRGVSSAIQFLGQRLESSQPHSQKEAVAAIQALPKRVDCGAGAARDLGSACVNARVLQRGTGCERCGRCGPRLLWTTVEDVE
eukprot:364940-Chlamydomonas_euryale.AAC.9